MGLRSGSRLMQGANRARQDPASSSPFRLWRLADGVAHEDPPQRAYIFRHAMIHAGYLTGEDGHPYSVCTICTETLE